ncbi:MAG: type II toxin-antitoxin system RelE/ParE family toxin [Verrucomicrobiales bacterium]
MTNYAAARSDFFSTPLRDALGNKSNSGRARNIIERVILTPEADNDVTESYNWYEEREPGLGEDFLRCVEPCVSNIQRHPLMYPVASDEFRRALIRRFPFEVFYEPASDNITIYSVFHCSQDPRKWRERSAVGPPDHQSERRGRSAQPVRRAMVTGKPTCA